MQDWKSNDLCGVGISTKQSRSLLVSIWGKNMSSLSKDLIRYAFSILILEKKINDYLLLLVGALRAKSCFEGNAPIVLDTKIKAIYLCQVPLSLVPHPS